MSGGSQNTVSQETVPGWLQPYFTQALQSGENLLGSGGPQYYPGNTVAPLNALQEQGIQSGVDVANSPNASNSAQQANMYENSGALINPNSNPYMQAINQTSSQPNAMGSAINANNFLTSGALLNPSSNPYLQSTFQQGANAVQNQLESEFAANGSNVINSEPVQANNLNNLATQLYGGAYQQGVNTMQSAAANAPGLYNAQYTPAELTGQAYGQGLTAMNQAQAVAPSIDQGTYLPSNALTQLGSGVQNQSQNLINSNMNQWNYNQQLPYSQLSWYSGLLGTNAAPFGGSSSSGTMNNNSALTDAGLGLEGAGLLSSLGAFGGGAGAGLMAGGTDAAATAVMFA